MKNSILKILKEELSKSNFERSVDSLGELLSSEGYGVELDAIKKYVKKYIIKNNFTIKFLNSCGAGFAGVRTKNQIIICSPSSMGTLGDFIYTIFHEIRHEHQISTIKMKNPLSEFDLNDFEKLNEEYWEMELDADQFAKNKVATLVQSLKIPIDLAKKTFGLSGYISQYPSMSKSIRNNLENIVNTIKKMKEDGIPYEDIQDHPFVKKHLENLEDFI